MTSTYAARLGRSWRGNRLLMGLLWACSPGYTVLGLAAALLQAVAAAGIMICSGRLVDGVVQGELATGWLVLTLTALVLQPVGTALVDIVGSVQQGRATPLLLERVATLASRPHGIEHLEDPEARQSIDAAIEEINQQYFLGVQSTWQTFGYRLWGVAALVVLASWSWWVALVVLAATLLLNVRWSAYSQRIFEDIFRDRSRRRARWYRNLLVDQESAKEVRLFGLTGFGLDRMTATWREAMVVLWAGRRDKRRPIFLATGLMLAAYAVALAALGHDAWVGAISTAVLLSSAQALTQIDGLGMLGDMQTMVNRQVALLLDLDDLSRRLPEATSPTPQGPSADGAPSLGRPPSRCTTSASPTPVANVRPSSTSTSRSRREAAWRSWGPTEPASRRSSSCCAGCTDLTPAPCGSTGATPASTTTCGAGWPSSSRSSSATTCRFATTS